MYTGVLHLHHWLRYVALILIIASIIKAFMNRGKNEAKGSIKLEMFTMMTFHIQFVLGMMLYALSPKLMAAFSDMGEAMSNPALRLVLVEHPTIMVISLILITLGYRRLKRKETKAEASKTILIFYGISLALVLSRIPSYSWTF